MLKPSELSALSILNNLFIYLFFEKGNVFFNIEDMLGTSKNCGIVSNYKDPNRSTNCSTSSTFSSLHQKIKSYSTIPFDLINMTKTTFKHLLFLSFHTVPHIQCGMILNHFF
ncbi:hypothetical protein HAX54_017474 [Datura stramonium]|uniref:Uncharacterized protein n=1 Tax=Datura stramonium TaxID=4076 RepID=A0ABS8UKU1_DATST|nr:hypothetical protein [Datura stramonium]